MDEQGTGTAVVCAGKFLICCSDTQKKQDEEKCRIQFFRAHASLVDAEGTGYPNTHRDFPYVDSHHYYVTHILTLILNNYHQISTFYSSELTTYTTKSDLLMIWKFLASTCQRCSLVSEHQKEELMLK